MWSAPLIDWDLCSSSITRNSIVCEFHNLAEGHVTYFCKDVIKGLLTESACQELLSVWKDSSQWGPGAVSIPPFPGSALGQMNGHHKEVVGQHADVILYKLFYSRSQRDLWRIFREGQRNALACRLVGDDIGTTVGWRRDDWKTYYAAVPWLDVFLLYVVPLARMMRGLTSVFQSRDTLEEHGPLDTCIREYIVGARTVLGEEFLLPKGIFHRLRHLLPQATGKSVTLGLHFGTNFEEMV